MREFLIGVFVGIAGTWGMAWVHFWWQAWWYNRRLRAKSAAAQIRRIKWELRDPE